MTHASEFLASEDRAAVAELRSYFPGTLDTDLGGKDYRDRALLQRSLERPVTLRPGFFNTDDPLIPSRVRQATDSVFMIVLMPQNKENMDIVNTDSLQKALSGWKDATLEESQNAQVAGMYLQRCLKLKQPTCAIPSFTKHASWRGTAFVVGDEGRDLLTSKHIYSEVMKRFYQTTLWTAELADLRQPSFKDNFHTFLFDKSNRLVSTPDLNPLAAVACGGAGDLGDHVRLRAGMRLGRGLKIAEAPPVHSELAYHIGFPGSTGAAARYDEETSWDFFGTRFPYRDAVGGRMFITQGVFLQDTDAMLRTTADGMLGMSGGPTVNQKGEVTGLIRFVEAKWNLPPSRIGRPLLLRYVGSIPAWELIK